MLKPMPAKIYISIALIALAALAAWYFYFRNLTPSWVDEGDTYYPDNKVAVNSGGVVYNSTGHFAYVAPQ